MNTDANTEGLSQAHTRGVLMALARRRDWYFEPSLGWELLWCIFTLGTWPLLVQSRRFDRFCRLEWNQYHAFGQWLTRTRGHPIAAELEAFAEKAAGKPSRRLATTLCILAAVAIAAIAFLRTHDLRILAETVYRPQSLLWPAIAYSVVLSIGWFAHLAAVLRQQTMTSFWIGRLNEMLTAQEKRPVPLVVAKPRWRWLMTASLLALIGPPWAAAALIALVMQKSYTRTTRPARLAMVERMLEWMDTSGLPVEFDIEEIAPEELVAVS